MPSPVKAYLYDLLGDEEAERIQWEKLARDKFIFGQILVPI